jgi:hypothetical protein
METDAVGRAGMTGSVEEFFCARSYRRDIA